MKVYLGEIVKLRVLIVEEDEVHCTVEEEGYVGNNQTVHLPMAPISMPSITSSDTEDIQMALDEEVDFIAVSKVQNGAITRDLKGILTEKMLLAKRLREKSIMIISKISTFEGLKNMDDIINSTDGIMIQRNDLDLEIPPEKVYMAQKEIIGKCISKGKPVICSGNLMKTMIKYPRAASSDIFDVGGCIFDGADCISLTAETAIGNFPSEVIEQSNHIIREAEAAGMKKFFYNELTDKLRPPIEPKVAIGMAACLVAEKIQATAIIVLTSSGKSAEIVSYFRPRCIVIGMTRYERTAKQMNLWRSILPLHFVGPIMADWCVNVQQRFQYGIAFGKEVGFIRCGDPMVLVSGYGKYAGFTNCLRIIYATTEPAMYLEHPKEYYDSLYLERDFTRPQNKLPYNPCR